MYLSLPIDKKNHLKCKISTCFVQKTNRKQSDSTQGEKDKQKYMRQIEQNKNHKEAEVAILISDKVEFKAKSLNMIKMGAF